jgi:hypothetical protein
MGLIALAPTTSCSSSWGIGAVVVACFAIPFTGRYPRGMFDFVEGFIRYQNRVIGYALVLVTDEYPPFRLAA